MGKSTISMGPLKNSYICNSHYQAVYRSVISPDRRVSPDNVMASPQWLHLSHAGQDPIEEVPIPYIVGLYKAYAHMLHGAGIFTNICPKKHPVL